MEDMLCNSSYEYTVFDNSDIILRKVSTWSCCYTRIGTELYRVRQANFLFYMNILYYKDPSYVAEKYLGTKSNKSQLHSSRRNKFWGRSKIHPALAL
jgi:hypothetical protein